MKGRLVRSTGVGDGEALGVDDASRGGADGVATALAPGEALAEFVADGGTLESQATLNDEIATTSPASSDDARAWRANT